MIRPKNCKKCGGIRKMQTGGQPKQSDYIDYDSWKQAMEAWMTSNNSQNPVNIDLSSYIPEGPIGGLPPQQPSEPVDYIQQGIDRGIYEVPNEYGNARNFYDQFTQSPAAKKKSDLSAKLQGAGLGIKRFSNLLSEISGRIERNRQNNYDYTQQTALGLMNPMPANDFQPNPYNLYMENGGSLKRYQQGGQKQMGDVPADATRNVIKEALYPNFIPPKKTLTKEELSALANQFRGWKHPMNNESGVSFVKKYDPIMNTLGYLTPQQATEVNAYMNNSPWYQKLWESLPSLFGADNIPANSPLQHQKYGGLQELQKGGYQVDELLINRNVLPEILKLGKLGSAKFRNFKKGGIHIDPKNKGKFTDYCGGKVTDECIQKGLNSPSATIRKRAQFAKNSRSWNK